MPMPGTSQPQLHPDTLTPPSNQTLRRATGACSSERRPPGLSAPLAQPHVGRGPQTPSPGAPRGNATPWGVTLEGLAGALRHSSGSALRLDNLFHFSAPGACPADVTQECLQTDSKDRRNLTATTTGGAKRGRGDQARHGEREERGNGQKPRTPHPHSWRPPSRGLSGSLGKSWFPDDPGAGRAQRHAWAQGPQQDGHDGPVVKSWCCESVPELGREPGGRARRWSPRRAERRELHTAQRASKATLNSFSLLVLFFVWLGVFFLLFF